MRRRRICGFESGDTYDNSPSDGNIVVDATSKRTGSYGLHVTAQSGVKSTLQITGNIPALSTSSYIRFYMKKVSLPTSGRVFLAFFGNTPGTSNLEVYLNSDGTLSLSRNSVIFATSSIALTDSRFYMIEIGYSDGGYVQLQIDGYVQVAWTYSGQSTGSSGFNPVFGALDTVAAGMEYYIDDLDIDLYVFPGPGRVERLAVTTLRTDNAAYSLVGAADKAAAINDLPPFDDDAGYLLTSTNNAVITFNVAGKPAAAKAIRGIQWYMRLKRNGASNGSVAIFPAAYSAAYAANSIIAGAPSTASYVSTPLYDFVDDSPLAPLYSDDVMSDLQILIKTTSSNASRITAVWGEIGYDDSSDAAPESIPVAISTFSNGPQDALSFGSGAVTGTAVLDTSIAKEGGDSLKITHPSGSNSLVGFDFSSAFSSVWGSSRYEMYVGCWVRIDTLPTSGNVGIWYLESGNFFLGLGVVVGSDGSLNTYARTSGWGTATAAGIITAGTWHWISMYFRADSASGGVVKVWVDDVLVITRTGITSNISSISVKFYLGSASSVTGGAVTYYDNLVVSLTVRHTQHVHFQTIKPTGSGSLTQAAFTAVGASNKWDCLDDVPDNDDTDYVLTSATNGHIESYALGDMDSLASTVYGVCVYTIAKRDGASNGSIVTSFFDPTRAIPSPTDAIAYTTQSARDGSAYTYVRSQLFGALTPEIVNRAELSIKQNGSNQSRITSLYATVLYTRTNPRARSRGSSARVIG